MSSHDDLCYATTAWQRHIYEAEKAENPDLDAAVRDGLRRFGAWDRFGREIFARLYDPHLPELGAPTGDAPWAGKTHALASELPEWQRLSGRVAGDEWLCGMATSSILNAVDGVLPGSHKPDAAHMRQDIEALQEMAHDNAAAQQAVERMQQKLEAIAAAGDAAAKGMDDGEARIAIRAACEQAQQAIDEAEEALAGFGCGSGIGRGGAGTSSGVKAILAKRIRNDNKLKRIAELAGRFRRKAAAKQRSKVAYAREEVSDIEVGADIGRLLPAELARFASPKLRPAFNAAFVEKKLLQYKLDGKDTESRGPIVMCLDESGSMGGHKEIWCKAVFLALMEVAQRQKRAAAIVHFSGSVGRIDVFMPNKTDPQKVIEAAAYFQGGGTNFHAPLMAALDVINNTGGFKKADVILVTDGEATTPGEQWHTERKRLGVTCYGVAIGSHHAPSSLKSACDETLCVADMSVGSQDETKVCDKLFGI